MHLYVRDHWVRTGYNGDTRVLSFDALVATRETLRACFEGLPDAHPVVPPNDPEEPIFSTTARRGCSPGRPYAYVERVGYGSVTATAVVVERPGHLLGPALAATALLPAAPRRAGAPRVCAAPCASPKPCAPRGGRWAQLQSLRDRGNARAL